MPALVRSDPVGNVSGLFREFRRIFVDDGSAVHANQREVLAVSAELEVRMQRAARLGTVFPGREHDQVQPGIKHEAREAPLAQLVGIIGEAEIRKVDGSVGGVVDFDPVGAVIVLILVAVVVDSQELADHEILHIPKA